MKSAWTVMIYMNVEPDGFDIGFRKNQLEMAFIGSTNQVQIIILADRNPPAEGEIIDESEVEFLYPSIFRIEKGKEITMQTKPLDIIRNDRFGSPVVLKKFLDYCQENYPAEKYMLSFWDHGAGNGVTASSDEVKKLTSAETRLLRVGRKHLMSVLYKTLQRLPVGNTFNFPIQARMNKERLKIENELRDIERDNTQDYLYVKEIHTAVKKSFGKRLIDVIAFDACWMQMFENAYTLKDCARFLVASENLISLQGFGYYMFLKYLTKDPKISPSLAAVTLIKSCYLKVPDTIDISTSREWVKLYYNKIYDDTKMTLSCIDLSVTGIMASKIDELSVLLRENMDELFEIIRIARFLCLTYFDEEDPADYDLKVIDLIYFLKKLSENLVTILGSKNKNNNKAYRYIIKLANEIAEIAEMRFIIYKEMGTAMREEKETDKRWGTHGFSIFFPEHFFEWDLYKRSQGWYFEGRKEIQIPFAEENNWKKFLDKYFKTLEKHLSE